MSGLRGDKPKYSLKRAGVGVVAIVAILAILVFWQRANPYSIETSVDIDATPQEVWSTLTDFAAYPDWNPTLTGMRGKIDVGSTLSFENDGMQFSPTVREVEENRVLRWEGHVGIVGIFDGDHSFVLEELPSGRTRFTQSELFRGVAVLFVTEMLHGETAPSFHAMNAALRDRVEGESPG